MSAGQLLLLVAGTAMCSRSVDAYIPSASLTPTISKASASSMDNYAPFARRRSLRLYSSDPSTQDDSDSSESVKDESLSLTSALSNVTATTEARFGEVTPMRRNSSAQFGDVVSISSRPSSSSPSLFADDTSQATSNKASGLSDVEMLKQRKIRNIGVAILSIALAVGNYAYQWTHPVTPIQLLVNMERSSTPLSDIGKNSKPTVIDFWAPWCENCRYMAPTLFQLEESYNDKVNFVMVNGDDPNNWPLIEALGVDAIPHMALVEADGTVDTALIGAVPKEWLSRDIDVLLDNASKDAAGDEETPKQKLPYQMLDVFANRPENRKLVNVDTIVGAGRR